MSDIALAVRPATPDEAPILARHRALMFRDMGRLADEAAVAALRAASEPMIREWMEAGTYLGWLAAPTGDPGGIVGGAGLQLRPLLPRPGAGGTSLVRGPEAYVLNVYVERSWRRQGVAGLLMDRVLAHAQAAGLKVVTLHASDAGRPLYVRLGFSPTNELRLR